MTYRELLEHLRTIERNQGADRLDAEVLFVHLDSNGVPAQFKVRNVDWADMSVPGAEYGQLILCEV